jgi:hypothetical protein
MDMVDVKVSELNGAALDWAVAQVRIAAGELTEDERVIGLPYLSRRHVFGPGVETNLYQPDGSKFITHGPGCRWSPSADWDQVGPLVDEYDIWLSSDEGDCVASLPPHANEAIATGPTNLIAICRAIVAAKLGDMVQVPVELVAGC